MIFYSVASSSRGVPLNANCRNLLADSDKMIVVWLATNAGRFVYVRGVARDSDAIQHRCQAQGQIYSHTLAFHRQTGTPIPTKCNACKVGHMNLRVSEIPA